MADKHLFIKRILNSFDYLKILEVIVILSKLGRFEMLFCIIFYYIMHINEDNFYIICKIIYPS